MVAHTNAHWTPIYARFLLDRGHDVLVVSFAPEAIEGVRVEYLGARRYVHDGSKHLFVTRALRLRRMAERFAPDIVFAPYLISNGLVAALATRAPLVVSARGGDVLPQVEHTRWRRLIAGLVVRAVCRRAQRVHCVSENLRMRLVEIGVPADRIERFPLGVDLARHFPSDPAPPGPHLISTRRQVPNSDLPTLVGALRILASRGYAFACTIAGGGPLLDPHRTLVAAAGLADRVTLVGEIPACELAERLRSSSIYVSTSLSDGTSSSLLEAMATGLLPVVTRIEANLPWLDDGRTGLLYRCGDVEDLSRCLERALGDAALRQRARRLNPERIAHEASLAVNLERMERLLEAAAGESFRCEAGRAAGG